MADKLDTDFLRDLLGLPPTAPSKALGMLTGQTPSSALGLGPAPGPGSSFAKRPSEALGLGTTLNSNAFDFGALGEEFRRRPHWNDRFNHWMKSESTTETQMIERARDMVKDVLGNNSFLRNEGIRFVEQGSFTNRTNTRGESDIDLRVVHPYVQIIYARGVENTSAWYAGGYSKVGRTFLEVLAQMRTAIVTDLGREFGRSNVDGKGSKAIKVNGNQGTRSEVDVVPSFRLDHIVGGTLLGGNQTIVGAALLSTSGEWTYNYPDQHILRGQVRHDNTKRRFKKVIRILKRMQADMAERGLPGDRVPSFLIECLVNLVPDEIFLFEEDWYDRVKRVLHTIHAALFLPNMIAIGSYTEINGIKPLFGGNQAWTLDKAQQFVIRAIAHLGDA